MRIGLFVDGSNMIYAQKHNGWRIDWKKVFDYYANQGDMSEAHYFSVSPYYEDSLKVRRYRAFCYNLTMMGYTVHDKEVKLYKNKKTGRVRYKGNLDIELALVMQAAADNFDQGVLFAGDGDYCTLVEQLRDVGKQVTCVCRQDMTSMDLINATNIFIALNELRVIIEKN